MSVSYENKRSFVDEIEEKTRIVKVEVGINGRVNAYRGTEIACVKEMNPPACGTGSLTCICMHNSKNQRLNTLELPQIKTTGKGSEHIAFEAKLQIPEGSTRKSGI